MSAGTEQHFTEADLNDMGRRTLDLVLERISAGELDAAAALAQRMQGEFQAMHDLYLHWVTHLLGFIGRRFGDAVLGEALEASVAGYSAQFARRYEGKSPEKRLQLLAAGLRGHLQPFDVTEEADRYVVSMPLCGSGGRLVRDGHYDGPEGLHRIAEPQEMTFGRADFPVYCAHCHYQNITPVGGGPMMTTVPAERLGAQPCRMHVLKQAG